MPCRIRSVFVIALFLVPLPSAIAGEPTLTYGPMRPQTVAILRSAIIEATPQSDEIQLKNLEELNRLAKVSWPKVTKLRKVHLILKNPESFREDPSGWLLAEDGTTLSWITPAFKRESILKVDIRLVEKTDFQTEVRAFLRRLTERAKASNKLSWDLENLHDHLLPLLLFRLAYLAADHGLQKETTLLIEQIFKEKSGGLPAFNEEFAWRGFYDAMIELHWGRDRGFFLESAVIRDNPGRGRFLKSCKELRAAYPDSKYDEELRSLIEPLERESMVPEPPFVKKNPDQLTGTELIRFWIYQLRDLSADQLSNPGYPAIFAFSQQAPTPADQIVAIGPSAIPFLIEALEDSTPTRTLVDNRHQLDGYQLLRRQDIAFQCLEHIVGCQFYHEDGNLTFASDTKERRSSALAHVKAWWAMSKGASQSQMVRNYLASFDKNLCLKKGWYFDVRLQALRTLGMLEGPESVAEDLQQINEERFFDEPTLKEELIENRSSLSEQEISQLVAAIESMDVELRRRSIAQKGQVSPYQVQRALLHALRKEAEPTERMKILQALEKYPKLWHLTDLIHVLETDKDDSCRVKAGQIISGILKDKSRSGWWIWLETRETILRTARRLVRNKQTPVEVRFAAFDILLAWDSFVDRPLLALLAQNPDFKFQELKLRFHDLLKDVQKNEDVVSTLIGVLGENNASRREQAARALGMAGTDAASAVPHLIAALKDKNRSICSEAAAALAKIGPKAAPAIPALIQLFKLDILDYTCRREAGDALLRLDPEGTAVVPALIEILRTKNEDEGWLAGPTDKHLKENTEERTWLAIEFLGSLGSRAKAAVPALRDLLNHQSSMVRGAAVEALKKIEQGKSKESKPD